MDCQHGGTAVTATACHLGIPHDATNDSIYNVTITKTKHNRPLARANLDTVDFPNSHDNVFTIDDTSFCLFDKGTINSSPIFLFIILTGEASQ